MLRLGSAAFLAASVIALLAPAQQAAEHPSRPPGASLGAPQPLDEAGPPTPPVQAPHAVVQQANPRRVPLSAFWDNGLRLESENDAFHLHLGGMAQVDSTWFGGPKSLYLRPDGGDNGVNNSNATLLRRARLRADGDINNMFDYIVEYDLATASDEDSGDEPLAFSRLIGTPSPASVWLQIRDVPLAGHVRIGYQLKPIGMTNNTSAAFLPFLERADNSDAFYAPFDNGFTLGISARNWIESERLAWVVGLYRPSTNVFGVTLNRSAYGARVFGTPVFEGDGERLIHLGFGYFGSELPENRLRVRARPLLRNGPGFAVPVLVDTGQLPGDFQYSFGPEFALVHGPLTLQAEWTGQFLTDAVANGVAQGTVFFHGGYMEALWFLTGEYQPYLKREGVFGRVLPRSDYYVKRHEAHYSLGAWQLGVRFSYLDLNNKAIQGGEIYDWTFGVNWFLNPNVKFQANYILEHRQGPTGTPVGWISGAGVRATFDF